MSDPSALCRSVPSPVAVTPPAPSVPGTRDVRLPRVGVVAREEAPLRLEVLRR